MKNAARNDRTRPLQLEQLEARLMNAIDAIELGLEAFTSSSLRENTLSDVPGHYGLGNTRTQALSNRAPTIIGQITFLTGNVVSGNTARATVLGSDDGGEQGLVYRWGVSRAPSGSNVLFSANHSNSAKNTTLWFNRAGEYEIKVTATDRAGLTATSTARITVNPILTSLQLLSADGSIVNTSVPFNTAFSDPAFQVRGIDQFGQVMTQPLAPTWTLRSGPQNSSMSQSPQGGYTRFQFGHYDQYNLQASVGDKTLRFSVQNVRSSARLDLIDASGRLIQDSATVDIASDRASVTMRVLNQQGSATLALSNASWTVRSAPVGGTARVSLQGTLSNIVFNKLGVYEFAVQANGQTRTVRFRVQPVLASLSVTPSSASLSAGQSRQFTAVRLDQFGSTLAATPAISWSANRGTITSTGLYTAPLTAGVATVTATSGSVRSTVQISIAAPTVVATSLQLRDVAGNVLSDTTSIASNTSNVQVEVRLVDSSGRSLTPSSAATMTVNSAPANGTASLSMNGSIATIALTRAGNYELTFNSGGQSRRLRVTANATLTSLQLTPNSVSIQAGQTRQFNAVALDQFGQSMVSQPTVSWSATGGSISSSGLFTAGSAASSSASVRAQAGSISATASVTVTAPVSGIFQNANISQLVQTYYVDQMLDRTEVMAILRSVGNDSVVDATELNDLRSLVNSTQYVMPSHVRGLARNMVIDNPANLRFQGQTAGNLTAGASARLLNNLVDKWFLGVDLPALTGQGIGYTRSTGTLFQVGPTLTDTKQGMLGDCYFLAAVGSIASRNQQAIRDMFDDNGDGTFTVRFFGRNSSGIATADYVTVDRRVPTFSGSILAYAGYGASALSSSTVLWAVLAEKAYAQWNETGRAGRNGANTFSGIEGGWMSNVNFQVLGYNSTNYSFATASQQTLISALDSGFAVTAGTKASVPSGLVASHAYSITGYDRATGRFSIHNPWGTMHPSPMNWAQLQTGFTMFTTTDPRGSGGDVVSNGFRSEWILVPGPTMIQNALVHHEEFGGGSRELDTPHPMEGCSSLVISAAWPESGTSVDLLVESTAEEEPEYGGDSEKEGVGSGICPLKDLALMDLYFNVALR